MSNTDILFTPMLQRLPPALLALGAQLVALLAVAAAAVALRENGTGLPLPLWIALAGLAAALSSRWLGLPTWWQFINLVFVPLLWLALQSGIDPVWFLFGFALLALTSLGVIRTRVPLYLSSPRAAEALAARLPENARVLDLGCGLGGPLARLNALRPDATLRGVEAAPLNWLIARLRLRGRARIDLGNLWDSDLSGHDVVYAYLSPAPMPRLWEKARAEMRPGSLFISNTFGIPGVEPDEVVELHDLSHARLLIWRMR
ncbi:MAG: hypothetical protein Q8O33_18965 [Pseudomonadota bacterium]|nr:hypothetical protein [Pseudomonadota bacterium]